MSQANTNLHVYYTDPGDSNEAMAFCEHLKTQGCVTRRIDLTDVNGLDLDAFPWLLLVFNDLDGSLLLTWRERTRYLGGPLISAINNPDEGSRQKILACGATEIFNLSDPFEQLHSQLLKSCQSTSVHEQPKNELVEPFIAATKLTMMEMARLDASLDSTYQKINYRMFGDLSAMIALTNDADGSMVLCMPQEFANQITERILSKHTLKKSPEMVKDCAGEIANVIAGQAKGILASKGHRLSMSTPMIVSGPGHEIRHSPGLPCYILAWTSELGNFALQLCFALKTQGTNH